MITTVVYKFSSVLLTSARWVFKIKPISVFYQLFLWLAVCPVTAIIIYCITLAKFFRWLEDLWCEHRIWFSFQLENYIATHIQPDVDYLKNETYEFPVANADYRVGLRLFLVIWMALLVFILCVDVVNCSFACCVSWSERGTSKFFVHSQIMEVNS